MGTMEACYELKVCLSPNSYVEALVPSMVVFGDGAFREVTRVKRGHKRGALVQ